jgi:nucleotide-binding universal stress UspA family protein
MQNVPVPTDFSPLADDALRLAADLARTYGTDIILVHYIPFSIARANTAEGAVAVTSYLDEQDTSAVADPGYKDIQIIPITCRDAGGIYESVA